jgi:hypothetical protein
MVRLDAIAGRLTRMRHAVVAALDDRNAVEGGKRPPAGR